ncbi:MAG: glycine betaine/L-proline ABC transporter substrate-binding protein ProX [Hormoscilla sp. SP5CHS1]|nr:glycine betaine/L-proline ABC transporter substrate-binding protein ProX [Hormoscilla sp. SP5CHS1]
MRTRKFALATALAALLIGACACSPKSEDTEGKAAKISYGYDVQEEIFQTEVINIGLEKLGYRVETGIQLPPPSMHIAVANGDVDYATNHWYPQQNSFFENAGGDEKLSREGVLVDNCLQGYVIDKKTADKYKITNLSDLKKPEIAKLFDTDGDGKANLIGCNAGWSCELVIEHHLEAYGLQDTVEQERGTYFALMGDTIARFQEGKPILYFSWTPLWLNAVLKNESDVVWLGVSFTSLPADHVKEAREAVIDGKNLGFSINQQRILASNQFLDANPAVRRFFEQVEIPIADVSAQNLRMYDGEDTPEDIRRHAEEWVANHQELFDRWVAEAKKAGQ